MEFNLFRQVSKYRTELMGYAILGVFICHIFNRTDIHSFLLATIPRLVYTQGFLFLSGFGLYYSFSQKSDLSHYFDKRLRRVFFPYFIISFPFFVTIVLLTGQSVLDLIGYLSTLIFWLKGNFYGMWYIAITLAMYLLFPLVYKGIFYRPEGVLLRGAIIILLFFSVIVLVNIFFPNYYSLVGQWIHKTVMFPIGILSGYVSKNHQGFKYRDCYAVLISLILLFVFSLMFCKFLYEYSRSLVGIFCLPFLFEFLSTSCRLRWINSVLRWLGLYSLELYVLHVLMFKTVKSYYEDAEVLVMACCIVWALLICVPIHNMIENIDRKLFKAT